MFSGISQFEGSLFAATKNTKSVAKTTVIGAIINTVCNFIFIYYFGAVGAALATLIGYFATWYLRTKQLQSFIKMKVNWRIHFISIALVFVQTIVATVKSLPMIQIASFVLLILLNKELLQPIIKKVLRN